jgi:hypothetical protein
MRARAPGYRGAWPAGQRAHIGMYACGSGVDARLLHCLRTHLFGMLAHVGYVCMQRRSFGGAVPAVHA